MDDVQEDEFGETSVPQGEYVLIFARSIGFLVGIVAVILAVLLMMAVRAVIALGISKLGVIGLSTLLYAVFWGTITVGNVNPKNIWTFMTRSCM